ncbi:MAG: hypothetical protein GXP30_09970 [Verrucomicrobia bacterium]|nr:hypothetical protein [Verrucomicrobiota bacterium]
MKNDIYYHRYTLKGAFPLNARSQKRAVEGCLIRVGAGVGCIHPWEALGDEALDRQLDALNKGRPHRLAKRAMHCARLDGAAREEGVSLFDELTIPDSHFTMLPGMALEKKKVQTFARIKLKGSLDLEVTKEEVLRCLRCASSDSLLRIDFNEVLDHAVAMNLAQALGEELCERIEFIEDPIRFDADNWSRLGSQTGLPLAVDRGCEKAVADEAELKWWVIKPALVDSEGFALKLLGFADKRNLVITSYMDHAIGQMFAAYEAAVLKQKYPDSIRECGLLTHELFDSDEFFEAVQSKGPKLMAPEGLGLGFDDQLERLPWKRLGD